MSHRKLAVISGLVLALAGCAADDVGGAGEALVLTSNCTIDGAGVLPSGDLVGGTAHGTDTTVDGRWAHVSPNGLMLGEPDFVFCRINGSTIGTFSGSATWNREPGYHFDIQVQDRGEPTTLRVALPTEVRTLTASILFRPTRWEDGELELDGVARVEIPAELPVVEGNAGNQWAWLTFQRADTYDVVRCRYRGGASSANPRGRTDEERGRRYLFDRCTGQWPGSPPIQAGDEVDVLTMELHLQSAARSCSDRVTVSVDLNVTPLETQTHRDYYRLLLTDPAGNAVIDTYGDLESGDLRVQINQ